MAKHNNARLGRRGDLTARNFPSAQQEATIKAPPSRYDGPESSYRLAFTDTEFLLREELRPVRMQLELLKPEMVQAEQSIESTIVIFGSARIVSSDVAERLVTDARSAKDDTALRMAETHRSMARYYDEALSGVEVAAKALDSGELREDLGPPRCGRRLRERLPEAPFGGVEVGEVPQRTQAIRHAETLRRAEREP